MIQFLPCKHNLDVNFTITSVQTQYLKIVGNTTAPRASAVVTCSHNTGFEFRDISEVHGNLWYDTHSYGRGYQAQHPCSFSK